ncbi:MAG: glycogenin glucosyltransferase [Candelina mexicana]|nr:MAG: glycogenin glucosyltransferase [Candelina mexicana]
MAAGGEDVYCTLITFLKGATVLAHSLRDGGTRKKIAVLVTLDTLLESTVTELKELYDIVIPVEPIINTTPASLYLMDRPDLTSTFTKVALWRQTQFRRIVYIDADVVAVRSPDELFELETAFAAAPDIGWPDCFNSGMMILKPNMGDYYGLLALAQRGISFDGADQGLLNLHFRNWQRVSFTYNTTPSGHYQYNPAYRHYRSSVSMMHFIGLVKPWLQGRNVKGGSEAYDEMLGQWWAVYDRHYRAAATSRIVQQYVKGEVETPEEQGDTEEEPSTEETGPTHQAATQNHFLASLMEWDPARGPPPESSQPEASNFPQDRYNMSFSEELFRAPAPTPGTSLKDRRAGHGLKPIFPWEATQRKATRVFAEDLPPSPKPTVEPTPSITEDDTQTETASPTTPTAQMSPPDPWQSFSRTNAWDEIPEIERYVANFAQSRKGKIQVLYNMTTGGESIQSPSSETGPSIRRRSMKITDFPTEIERPSLPVTPAPVRRPSFWGEERDAAGRLPAAEGVPNQEDWDPAQKLKELSLRHSELLPTSPREIPDRSMPESAMEMPTPSLKEPDTGAGLPSVDPHYPLEALEAKGEELMIERGEVGRIAV